MSCITIIKVVGDVYGIRRLRRKPYFYFFIACRRKSCLIQPHIFCAISSGVFFNLGVLSLYSAESVSFFVRQSIYPNNLSSFVSCHLPLWFAIFAPWIPEQFPGDPWIHFCSTYFEVHLFLN